MLQLVDVHAGYGRSEVIHGVSIEVPTDGVAAVMGHNGAGKTTLLRAAVGLLKCNSGKVLFDGEEITKLRPSARVKRGLMLFISSRTPNDLPVPGGPNTAIDSGAFQPGDCRYLRKSLVSEVKPAISSSSNVFRSPTCM